MSYTPEEITEILEAYFESIAHRQYIGARYVPIFGRVGESSCDWDNTGDYEPLTIVRYQGNSYTSRQFVPAGADINNTDYWVLTGNFNAQVEQYRVHLLAVENALPIVDFDSTNTVKKYIDDGYEAINLEKVQVFDTVSDMKAADLVSGMVCHTNGFHTPADGGSAWYVIKNTGTANEMDVISCGSLFACLIIENSVSICQLGAKNDNSEDASDYLIRAFEIASADPYDMPNVLDDIYRFNIEIPKGAYLFETPNMLEDISFGANVIVNGNDSIFNFDSISGAAFKIQNNLQFVEWNNIVFVGQDPNTILFDSYSTGNSQGHNFNSCCFFGNFARVFSLTGTANNSEFTFNDCRMKGVWDSFLYVANSSTSDQFVNYHFNECKYWCNSTWIEMYYGGHVALTNCDVSGYAPDTDKYIFDFPRSVTGYGSCTFNDFGSRYELINAHSKVMNCKWTRGCVTFIGSDFSANAPNQNLTDAFNFESSLNSGIYSFYNCRLYGGITTSTNQYLQAPTLNIENCLMYYPANYNDFFKLGSAYSNKFNIDIKNSFIGNDMVSTCEKRDNGYSFASGKRFMSERLSQDEFVLKVFNKLVINSISFANVRFSDGNEAVLRVISKIGTVSSVSSNTITIELDNKALGVGATDEVIINGSYYAATAAARTGNTTQTFTVADASGITADMIVYIVLYKTTFTPSTSIVNDAQIVGKCIVNDVKIDIETSTSTKRVYGVLSIDYA